MTIVATNLKARKGNAGTGSMHIPKEVMEHLPADSRFTLEITEDGILYKPQGDVTETAHELPSWLKGEAPAAPATPRRRRSSTSS